MTPSQAVDMRVYGARLLDDFSSRGGQVVIEFDRAFCERVEREVCEYVLPVSDAANARVLPPTPHCRELLAAAARDHTVADFYADGYNRPDRFRAVAGSAERTARFLREGASTGAAVAAAP